ncbi:MAG: ribosome biogenesis GTP-binding protein YihA/YsxC [Alphaproteobacteria bacterium]|nr:ribosome biogenesis GTP-binding protein YihA/YsxC [Alphaproteobacteria bacterium]
MDELFKKELIAKGQKLFSAPSEFVKGVVAVDQLPASRLPEIAFAGRSNVGKSSLINVLTGVAKLARASNTPGRTQEINFFKLGQSCLFVDLPGYGYAAAPEKKVQNWTRLIHAYLRGRVQLRRVFLLVDIRHGIKKTDENIMKMLDGAAVSYQIVLTKSDKVSGTAAQDMLEKTSAAAAKHPACFPEIILTSASARQNIDWLRAQVVRVLEGI